MTSCDITSESHDLLMTSLQSSGSHKECYLAPLNEQLMDESHIRDIKTVSFPKPHFCTSILHNHILLFTFCHLPILHTAIPILPFTHTSYCYSHSAIYPYFILLLPFCHSPIPYSHSAIHPYLILLFPFCHSSIPYTAILPFPHTPIPWFQYLTDIADPTGGQDIGIDDLTYREGWAHSHSPYPHDHIPAPPTTQVPGEALTGQKKGTKRTQELQETVLCPDGQVADIRQVSE